MRKTKFDKPYISLKFGGIKSMDFNGNEEAKKIYDEFDRSTERTQEQEIEIIKAYKGNFYFWWEDRWGTKEEAIDYILNYNTHATKTNSI